jgi:hypothetical protein
MADNHYRECNTLDSPTLTFRLQQAGAPWDVHAGYTIQLVGEVDPYWDDLVPLTPVAASSGNPGADWAEGVVTVTLPTTWTEVQQRVNFGLVVTSTTTPFPAVQTDSGVLVVLHTPGAMPPA